MTGTVTMTTKGRVVGTPTVQWYHPTQKVWTNQASMTRSGSTWKAEFAGVPSGTQMFRIIARSGSRTTGLSPHMYIKSYAWFNPWDANSDYRSSFGDTTMWASERGYFGLYTSNPDTGSAAGSNNFAPASAECIALDLGLKAPTSSSVDTIRYTIYSDVTPPTTLAWSRGMPSVLQTGIPVAGAVIADWQRTSTPDRGDMLWTSGARIKCVYDPLP